MGSLCQRENTVVDRVRIRSRFRDALEAQQRIDHLLRCAELRPSTLPPSAILIIRVLRSQEPQAGWLKHKSVYLPTSWQQAITRELDRLAAQAARPVSGSVPTSAEAVVFADHAELLAFLARDWVRGTLRTHWWWSAFLRHGDAELGVLREWMQAPQFVPAAFDILAAQRCATEFLQLLPTEVASSLLDHVLAAFAIPRVNRPVAHAEASPSLDEEYLSQPAIDPWLPLVPEASAARDLAPGKKILLVQALTLIRAPVGARDIAFQQRLVNWQSWAESVVEHRTKEDRAPQSETAAPTAVDINIALQTADQPVCTAVENPLQLSGMEADAAVSLPRAGPLIVEITESSRPEIHAVEAEIEERLEQLGSRRVPASLESSFGGIFFLLNVALHLKLYADFTSPRCENLSLDIWDFLCLVGARFVPKEQHTDPVFPLLATLACRMPEQAPGEHFHPPENWHLPQEWLDVFPETAEIRKTFVGGRCQVLHPAGFLLSDEQLDSTTPPIRRLDRWLNWISTYIEARLARALGRGDAAQFLCAIPARPSFTNSRLDVFYGLDVYPVEIRKAGLDRDPGWIPAAGRFVAFHFE